MDILFLTDSLSLPRDTKEEIVKYEETYPYLLKEYFKQHNFIFLGIGGATVNDLFSQASYYSGFNPDLVFIQCGIVDCAPRPFRKFETKIITKLKIRLLFKPFLKFLVKNRNYKYTPISNYRRTLEKIKNNYFKKSKVYHLGILPAFEEYEKKLNGITNAINSYNIVLSKFPNYIDNKDFPKEGLLSDHHHMNEIGHKNIFNKIKSIIE